MTTTHSSVRIGPSYFANELQDYDLWQWAFCREALQNSIDARGSDRVDFQIELDTNSGQECTRISWKNNGEPMTREILVDKLFALGESGKRFEGSVGGFGKAKILLYFTHRQYTIHTGDLWVEGSGADYSIADAPESLPGTHSTVLIAGDHVHALTDSLQKMARLTTWSGTITLNGQSLSKFQGRLTYRREANFGRIYTSKADDNQLVVRVGGIPMFYQYCRCDRLVVVDIQGASSKYLTSNRDGLKSEYRHQLNDFVVGLTVDKRAALRADAPTYEHFAGAKLAYTNQKLAVAMQELSDEDAAEAAAGGVPVIGYGPSVAVAAKAVSSSPATPAPNVRRHTFDFVIKNETAMVIPSYYRVDHPHQSAYSIWLTQVWGRLILELHRMFDHEAVFSIGFVFSADAEAMYEQNEHFGKIYYLNPAEIVEQKRTYSKSFKKRFKMTERDRLIALAVHEFVHGLGYLWHDANYANKLTDVFGTVLKNRKRLIACFT